MPRPLLVAALWLALITAVSAHPHSAPTLWVDLAIEDGRIVYELTGQRQTAISEAVALMKDGVNLTELQTDQYLDPLWADPSWTRAVQESRQNTPE